jgi:CheY-like chemotaxis protein
MHDANHGRTDAPIDFAALKKVVPDHAEQIQVLRDFRSLIHEDLTKLLEALALGDQVHAERTAHRMHGASRMVGATALASACAVIEQAARGSDLDGARAARTALDEAVRQLESYFTELKDSNGENQRSTLTKARELNFLVIEDDDIQRRMVVNKLRSLGIAEVREAGNGKQALEVLHAANAKPVDIALCDLNMPEMDGMEFLRHMGQEKVEISIIILSVLDRTLLASVEKMSQAYGVRLLGIVEKPITLSQLNYLFPDMSARGASRSKRLRRHRASVSKKFCKE